MLPRSRAARRTAQSQTARGVPRRARPAPASGVGAPGVANQLALEGRPHVNRDGAAPDSQIPQSRLEVGRDRLIGGVAFIASSISEPGTIKHVGTMQRIVMGDADGGSSARVTALHETMKAGGIDAEISDDVERSIWEKFVFLVGMSSTTTLMNSEIGPIRSDPEGREFLHNVFREVTAVGRARGVDLPENFGDTRLDFADAVPAEMTTSMHHDLKAGNRLELPWLAGAVVRMGRQTGVPTPVCQTVYAALLPKAGI